MAYMILQRADTPSILSLVLRLSYPQRSTAQLGSRMIKIEAWSTKRLYYSRRLHSKHYHHQEQFLRQ